MTILKTPETFTSSADSNGHMLKRWCWFLLLVALAGNLASQAAAADWSANFVLPGANGTIRAMAEDAGAIYIGGDFTAVGDIQAEHVARIDKNTGRATALGEGIQLGINLDESDVFWESVYCLAVYNGELWVGGRFLSAGGVPKTRNLARWDGTSWKSVVADTPAERVKSLFVADGKLYVGGEFSRIANLAGTNGAAIWNGSEWSAVGTGLPSGVLPSRVNAFALTPSGVYLGGSFYLPDSTEQVSLAKWTGNAWTEVAITLHLQEVSALAVQGTDLLIGHSTFGLKRWNGTAFSDVGTTYRPGIRCILVSGTHVYAGGDASARPDYTEPAPVHLVSLAKFSGTAWAELGAGVQGTVHSLMASGGQIYAAGEFMQAGGVPAVRISRWNGTEWSPVVSAGSGGGVGGRVRAVLDAGNKIYVGGDFTVAGGVVANRIACWSKATRTWSALGTGMKGSPMGLAAPSTVRALAMVGNNLYAGGNFIRAGGVLCWNIARWNGTAWSAMNGGLFESVNTMLVSGTDLYVGGSFANSDRNKVARWTGSAWVDIGLKGQFALAEVNSLCMYGGALHASVAGLQGNGAFGVLKYTGSQWVNLDITDPPAGACSGLSVFSGKLLICVNRAGILEWDGTSLHSPPWRFGLSVGNSDSFSKVSLAVVNGQLYAGGANVGVQDQYVQGNYLYNRAALARLDGDQWVELLPENTHGTVDALTVGTNGSDLYVGGRFTDLGGKLSHNLGIYSVGVGEPEIEVKSTTQAEVVSGDTWNFGPVFTKASASATYTLKNTGTDVLYGEDLYPDGSSDSSFYIKTQPGFPIWPGGSATLVVGFAPTTGGTKAALLKIRTNDSDEPEFQLHLVGEAVVMTPPMVKTMAPTGVSHDTATLHGVVNAKNSLREVFFDYGMTTSYGLSVAATPATLAGNDEASVSVTMTGLQPHTKYHYRVRATGVLGTASGTNMTFTTLNRAPVATADALAVVPGCTVSLPVMDNDLDPDGDHLSLAVASVLSPATAGKLTKAANLLTFAASPTFSGQASFTYSVKDAFNGTSLPATVTLTPATCSIDSQTRALSSAGWVYPVTVTSSGAWSVGNPTTWMSVSPVSGYGDGTVLITVLPNAGKSSRTATMQIGGQNHTITQAGVQRPALSLPPVVPPAIVGGYYSLDIPTVNLPVTYAAKNLPPGLTLNGGTGKLSGRPTKEGKFAITLNASNAADKAAETLTFDIQVTKLPTEVVGSYQGLISGNAEINGQRGSRLELTTTPLGAFSGKIITGTASVTLKGMLDIDADNALYPHLNLVLRPKDSPALSLRVELNGESNTLGGELRTSSGPPASAGVMGWRNVWSKTMKATAYKALHNFVLEQPDSDPTRPQGWSYGSIPAVNETTGAVTVSGRTADGNAFASAAFVGQQGQVLLYQSLFGGKGSLAGALTITAGMAPSANTLAGTARWFKPAAPASPPSNDLVYKEGFGPLDLTVEGAAYEPVSAGQVVLGLANGSSSNAELILDRAPEVDLMLDLRLHNPGAAFVNKAVVPSTVNKINLSTLNPATGAFAGDFILPGVTSVQNRRAIFQGVIVKRATGLAGCGYFLMPESHTATAAKNSGRVRLRSLP